MAKTAQAKLKKVIEFYRNLDGASDAQAKLKKVIEFYRNQDGASDMGSYRDAFTDLLHLYTRECKTNKGLAHEAFYLFQEAQEAEKEEDEQAEIVWVEKMKRDEIPKHINHEFEFDSAREAFQNRLKGE